MRNPYTDYLDKHPARRKDYQNILNTKQLWIDRQCTTNGQLSEYYAYFYLLQYNKKYLGIVESERPNSATYLYNFPNNNIILYSYIYRTHLADPDISREANTCYINRIDLINLLLNIKTIIRDADNDNRFLTKKELALLQHALEKSQCGRVNEISYDDLETDREIIEEELYALTPIIDDTPIKYRDYFIGEIAHRGIEKWSADLENMITKYLAGKYEKEEPLYHIQCDNIWVKAAYTLCAMIRMDMNVPTPERIEEEIERNNVHGRKQKKAPEKQKNSYPIKQIKKEKYDPTLLYNKTVKDIAFMFHISPISLLFMIQRRICSKKIHCVNDINDILDKTKVSLCHRIFEEL